jgi:hypothetical protein
MYNQFILSTYERVQYNKQISMCDGKQRMSINKTSNMYL